MSESGEVRALILEELEHLKAEVEAVRPLLDKLHRCEPDDIEIRATALTLHGFYNGVEGIFLIIAKRVDRRVPEGFRWHRKLLDQMRMANEVRPAIIDQFEYDMLLEYLSFRHMVRHTYPGTLSWDGFREIAENLSNSRRHIDECIHRFLSATFERKTDEDQAPE